MRIALVTPYDLDMQGGVQQHVTHLAAELRTLGDEVHVFGPGREESENLTPLGIPVPVPSNGSISRIALSPAAWPRTVRVLRDFNPDITHVHEPTVPLVGPAAVFGNDSAVVATFHAWSESDLSYRMVRPLTSPLMDRISESIAVSPASASFHSRGLGVAEERFSVIPNGVDVPRFTGHEPFPQMREQPSLLFVGRLTPRKGLDVLIKAFVELRTNRPAVKLFIAGEGPDRGRCQSLVPADLRSDVIFLGRVSNEDLPRFYASADLFVAPARGGESFGIVLVEAMASGLVVVASDIPGYASVIDNGVNGRLVPPDDPEALAAVLAELLDNPQMRNDLSDHALVDVERYDWPRVTSQVRAVYEQALDK